MIPTSSFEPSLELITVYYPIVIRVQSIKLKQW